MIDEFDIDNELQLIAEKITENELNYGGALFEYNSTNEEFVIIVSKMNFMHDLKEENQQLAQEKAQLVKALHELVSTSEGNEEQLNDLLGEGNYGESKALCDAREILTKHK